jgi:hypothetical protein
MHNKKVPAAMPHQLCGAKSARCNLAWPAGLARCAFWSMDWLIRADETTEHRLARYNF